MVAPLASARIGGGGITLPVSVDTETLRAAIPQLTARIKQISDGLKIKPEVDIEQTAVRRALSTLRNQLLREVVKVQVQAEAKNLGLASPPMQMGVNAPGSGVNMYAPPDSYRTINEAKLQYQARMRLEQKFADQLKEEAEEGGKGNGRVGSIRALLRGGVYGYAAGRLADAYGAIGTASAGFSVGMSSDPYLRKQGLAEGMAGLHGIPVIGEITKAFDEMLGITRSLNSQMTARLDIERQSVSRAQLGGSAFSVASTEQAQIERELKRESEATLRRGVSSQAISSIPFIGQILANWSAQNVGDDLKAQAERMDEIKKTNKLRMEYLRRDSDTRIGLNELRVRNRGLHLADEDALSTIRGVDANIAGATTQEGKQRAALEGISSIRALRASYMARSGGYGQQFSPVTDMVGDPYNLEPELQAMNHAAKMSDTALGKLGQVGAPKIRGEMAEKLLPSWMSLGIGSMNEKLQMRSIARAKNLNLGFGGDEGVTERDTDLTAQVVTKLGNILDLLQNLTLTIK